MNKINKLENTIKTINKSGNRLCGIYNITGVNSRLSDSEILSSGYDCIIIGPDGEIAFKSRKANYNWYECQAIGNFLMRNGITKFRKTNEPTVKKYGYEEIYVSGPSVDVEFECWIKPYELTQGIKENNFIVEEFGNVY